MPAIGLLNRHRSPLFFDLYIEGFEDGDLFQHPVGSKLMCSMRVVEKRIGRSFFSHNGNPMIFHP
ncbi:MAG TPA: hypothetical protein VFF77_04850, partial [Holophagaceae bacterium]|nr:hypothetical protein [Holophagaceae bacterium]